MYRTFAPCWRVTEGDRRVTAFTPAHNSVTLLSPSFHSPVTLLSLSYHPPVTLLSPSCHPLSPSDRVQTLCGRPFCHPDTLFLKNAIDGSEARLTLPANTILSSLTGRTCADGTAMRESGIFIRFNDYPQSYHQSPERGNRPQAGVPLQLRWLATEGTQEPLQTVAYTLALKGRQDSSVTPSGLPSRR